MENNNVCRRKPLSLAVVFATASIITITSCAPPKPPIIGMVKSAPSSDRSFRGTSAAPLSLPENAGDVVTKYLAIKGYSAEVLNNTYVDDEFTVPATGKTYRRLKQTHNGKKIVGTAAHASLDASGALLSLSENIFKPQEIKAATIGVDEAFAIALRKQAPNFEGVAPKVDRVDGNTTYYTVVAPDFPEASKVTAVYVPLVDGTLVEGFEVTIWGPDSTLARTIVGQTGKICVV